MKIAVIGTGYVGLVSGICLASKGHQISCYDIDKKIIDQLNEGVCHIYEKGLDALLEESEKNINFKVLNSDNEETLMDHDAIIVAVGTPTTNNKIDLSQIEAVAIKIGQILRESDKYVSVIIKHSFARHY